MVDAINTDSLFSELKQVQAVYQKVVRLRILVWALIICVGFALAAWLIGRANDRSTLWVLSFLPLTVFFCLFLFYPQKVYKYTLYGLVDEVFYVQKGWLFKKRTAVSQNRIQHTDVEQGPFLRKYGLAQLILHTAGVKEADISISGLEYKEAIGIRDHLLELNKKNTKKRNLANHSDSQSSLEPSENSIATSVLALNVDKNIHLTEEE